MKRHKERGETKRENEGERKREIERAERDTHAHRERTIMGVRKERRWVTGADSPW